MFGAVVAAVLASAPVWAGATDTYPAGDGDISITPITHGSVQIDYAGMTVQVDPWGHGDYSQSPGADLILVTDLHGDHLDPTMIDALRKDSTELVAPAAAASRLEGATVLANGERLEIAGVEIEAVAMYNLKRGPEEGKLFHDKGRGNGYVLTLGGARIYLAGDTECIPEMKALEDIDVAFVPMNLPYTMTPDEAAECVRAFRPKVVYPYHYRGSDLEEFREALAGSPEIEVRVRDWYPGS